MGQMRLRRADSAPLHARAAAPAVPAQTPPPSGCALTYVQSNGSYSMFNDIINAAPQSANFSSAHPPPFEALAPCSIWPARLV